MDESWGWGVGGFMGQFGRILFVFWDINVWCVSVEFCADWILHEKLNNFGLFLVVFCRALGDVKTEVMGIGPMLLCQVVENYLILWRWW